MSRICLDHIMIAATMDDGIGDGEDSGSCGREIHDAAIIIENGIIQQIGTHDELEAEIAQCDDVLNFSHHIVIPGMVNTHHHLFQNLTRIIPNAQNESLFGWLQTLYPIWQNLQPDDYFFASCELNREGLYRSVVRKNNDDDIPYQLFSCALAVGKSKCSFEER